MAKAVAVSHFHISLENYKHGRPYIVVLIPFGYTFFDLLQIIKIYTGYSDKYSWEVLLPYYNNINLLAYFKKENFNEIKLFEYYQTYPNTIWNYGSIRMDIGRRTIKNSSKSYPFVDNGVGKFPTEDEFMKKIKIKNIDQSYKKDENREFDEKLKEYFKGKYKISDEIDEYFSWRNVNKLIRI